MRFYTSQHKHYCGIDLHARTMSLCILDQAGEILLQESIRCDPRIFLRTVAPYRDDLVVAVECIFTWDLARRSVRARADPFRPWPCPVPESHPRRQAKNDRIDAHKIATLLRGGMLPEAYVYPPAMRSTRDLLRRRLHLVRKRGQLLAHIQNTHPPHNLPEPSRKLIYRANRAGIADSFTDPSVRKSIEADFALVEGSDRLIREVELHIVRTGTEHDPGAFLALRSVPGIGKILALTLLYEIHDIHRFPRVQDFASYARLVTCAQVSAGKRLGTGGRKIGNAHRTWASSEAAVLFLRQNPRGQTLFKKLQRKHGKGKALSILAHKLGRAISPRLDRGTAFDTEKFLAA